MLCWSKLKPAGCYLRELSFACQSTRTTHFDYLTLSADDLDLIDMYCRWQTNVIEFRTDHIIWPLSYVIYFHLQTKLVALRDIIFNWYVPSKQQRKFWSSVPKGNDEINMRNPSTGNGIGHTCASGRIIVWGFQSAQKFIIRVIMATRSYVRCWSHAVWGCCVRVLCEVLRKSAGASLELLDKNRSGPMSTKPSKVRLGINFKTVSGATCGQVVKLRAFQS